MARVSGSSDSHSYAAGVRAPGTEVRGAVRRVAIAGFGTVGRSVARILTERALPELQLTHIFNRDVARKRVDWVPGSVDWTDRFDDILSPEVDIVVELAGGLTPAEQWIREALLSGRSVVTANKQVIAHCGAALLSLAAQQGCQLRFEAAVAGGVPVVRALQDGLAGDRLFRVVGILNGTCNYILTRMADDGLPFEIALAEAQKLGFAEADPADDLEGRDARAKLVILAALGLERWVRVDDVPCRSIAVVDAVDFLYARRLGCTIRQISQAERALSDDTLRASVGPALVPLASPLARAQGSQNIVLTRGEFGDEVAMSGRGAGGDPTAVAVVSDLLAIARESSSPPVACDVPAHVEQDLAAPRYVRFTVSDRPGIIASIASVLSRHAVNIDAVLQEPGFLASSLPFVMTLEQCRDSTFACAMEEIGSLDFHVRPPVSLPILNHGGRHASALQ